MNSENFLESFRARMHGRMQPTVHEQLDVDMWLLHGQRTQVDITFDIGGADTWAILSVANSFDVFEVPVDHSLELFLEKFDSEEVFLVNVRIGPFNCYHYLSTPSGYHFPAGGSLEWVGKRLRREQVIAIPQNTGWID